MNNNLLKQPIELQKNIYNFLNLYKLKKLNEVCVELNNNIDIKVQIINLKLIKEYNIINDWYLHSYESKILRNIVKKLYNNEDINKETYKKLNTDSVYDFDKSIGFRTIVQFIQFVLIVTAVFFVIFPNKIFINNFYS